MRDYAGVEVAQEGTGLGRIWSPQNALFSLEFRGGETILDDKGFASFLSGARQLRAGTWVATFSDSEVFMKRHSSSAFSTAILAMAVAAAGLFAAQQAQAQIHYGPGPGDGAECWATPVAGGYQMEYNATTTLDGDTRYFGNFTIVSTDGDKTYVQGSITGGGYTYTFLPTSWFTPAQHYYSVTWPGGVERKP
jgi:hypothetical protein